MRKSGRSKAEETVKVKHESENEEASGDDENSAFSKLKRGSKKASLDEARNKRKRRDDGDHEESDDNRSEENGNNSDDEEDKTSQSKKLKKSSAKGKKGVADSEDEENGHKSDEEEEKAMQANKKKKGAKGKKRVTDSEDDEAGKNGEEEEVEVSPLKKGKKVAKGKKRGASEDPADDVLDIKESDDEEIPLSKKMQAVKKNGMSKGKKRAAELEEKEEFEVESVVGSRLLRGKQQYRIRWKGFKAEDDTWEDEGGLDCVDAIKAYLDTCPEEEPVQGPRVGKKGNKKIKVKKEDQDTKDGNNSEAEVSKEEYEVDRIVDIFIKKDGKREFLVHWKGYNSKDNTWEPEEHLNCPDLISKYLAKVEDAKSRNEKDLRVSRKPTDRFTLSMGGGGRRISRRGQGKQRARYDDAE